MAADHEIAGIRQPQTCETGQLGDEPRAVRKSLGHGSQPNRDRRTDASKGAYQPEPDSLTCHVEMSLWPEFGRAGGRRGRDLAGEPAAHNNFIMAGIRGPFNRSGGETEDRACPPHQGSVE